MPVHSPDTAIKILAEWPTIQVQKLDETRLEILLPRTPLADSEVISAYSEESFVIDLSEPETQSFTRNAPSAFPDPENGLAQYVGNYISDTTSIHGFHIASKVAKQRSGDCTEHAVLTTALARSPNILSRIVLGTLQVEGPAFNFSFISHLPTIIPSNRTSSLIKTIIEIVEWLRAKTTIIPRVRFSYPRGMFTKLRLIVSIGIKIGMSYNGYHTRVPSLFP